MKTMQAFEAEMRAIRQDTVKAFAQERVKESDELHRVILIECEEVKLMIDGIRAKIIACLNTPRNLIGCLWDPVDAYIVDFRFRLNSCKASSCATESTGNVRRTVRMKK